MLSYLLLLRSANPIMQIKAPRWGESTFPTFIHLLEAIHGHMQM
jgi:hypothetical protein